ncbi:MAG: hypothetical protein ACRCXE_00240, partial [Metamycoplasmataceae bacterium]
LVKLFDGINSTNINNFVVYMNTIVEGRTYSVTLNANHGFTINGATTLTSIQFSTDINLIISAKTLVPYQITAGDVDNNNFKSYATLNKLFNLDDSISHQDFEQAVTVSMNPMSGQSARIIKISANEGFTINRQASIDSNSFVVPTNYVITKKSPAPTDIKLSDIINEGYNTFPVLNKLFSGAGFSQANLLNMNVELITITQDRVYQIRLTPKIAHTINNGTTGIVSERFTLHVFDLGIIKHNTPPNDIRLEQLEDPLLIKTKVFLAKFFNMGTVSQSDIDNYLNVTVRTVSIGTVYQIVLSPKNIDVKINGQSNEYVSNDFTLMIIDLQVEALDPIVEEITSNDVNIINLPKLTTLQKVFNMFTIDQDLINKAFTVTLNDNSEGGDPANSITLSTKFGYTINGQTNFTSSIFVVQIIMENVFVIENPPLELTSVDVTSGLTSLRTLQNFFTITDFQANNNITVVLNGDPQSGNPLTITLTAKPGFLFLTGRTITSVPFNVNIVLPGSPKTPSHDLTIQDVTTNLFTPITMGKLFNNVNILVLLNTTAKVNGDPYSGNPITVTLTAEDGYIFTNGKELTSEPFIPLP